MERTIPTETNKSVKVDGVLIAAGLSSRMGSFKPLLAYQGRSFLIQILLKMNTVCDRLVVVTGYQNSEINLEVAKYSSDLPHVELVTNHRFEDGMFTSLQTGLNKLSDSPWVLYHFTDQPTLPELFYHDFVRQISGYCNWIQPQYRGRNGHPVLMGESLCQTILHSKATDNLRSVLERSTVEKIYWDCNYPQILHDMDTPQDIQNFLSE